MMSSDDEKLCLICLDTEIAEELPPLFHNPSSSTVKCENRLDKHLWRIFLLRNLLHLPRRECETLLREGGEEDDGSPGEWCWLCRRCTRVVEEAYRLHVQVTRLTRQLEKLVETKLRSPMKTSFEVEEVTQPSTMRKSYRKIRNYFRGQELGVSASTTLDWLLVSSTDNKVLGRDQCVTSEEAGVGFKLFSSSQDEASLIINSPSGYSRTRPRIAPQVEVIMKEEEGDFEAVQMDVSDANESEDEGSIYSPESPPELKVKKTSSSDVKKRGRKKNGLPKSRRWRNRKYQKRGRLRKVKCDKCDFVTGDCTVMYTHRKNHHVIDNFDLVIATDNGKTLEEDHCQFRCNHCSILLTKGKLYMHLKQNHFDCIRDLLPLCHLCDKSFASVKNLEGHIRLVHEDNRHECHECDARFTHKHQLLGHLEKHKQGGRNPFVCEECGFQYSSRESLCVHKKKMHTSGGKINDMDAGATLVDKKREKKCKHCDLVLAHDYALKHHIKTTHSDLYVHKCSECDASYLHRAGLVTHMESKHSKEVVQCPNCDVTVKCKAYLPAHLRLYCKKKPQEVLS